MDYETTLKRMIAVLSGERNGSINADGFPLGIAPNQPLLKYLRCCAHNSWTLRRATDCPYEAEAKAVEASGHWCCLSDSSNALEVEAPTDCQVRGDMFHTAVLEPSRIEDRFTVAGCQDLIKKTGELCGNKARYFQDGKWKCGKHAKNPKVVPPQTPVSQKDFELARRMADSLHREPSLIEFTRSENEHEVSICWIDENTGVRCKCRPDIYDFAHERIVDFKFYHKWWWRHSIAEWAWRNGNIHQIAMDFIGAQHHGRNPREGVLIYVKPEPPHVFRVCSISRDTIERACEELRMGLRALKHLRSTGEHLMGRPIVLRIDHSVGDWGPCDEE